MGASDAKVGSGLSINGGKLPNGVDMELNEEEDVFDSVGLHDLGEELLRNFCRRASMSFFKEYGLISHQINSYNDFIQSGIQKIFDSIGEIIVEPGFDPSKKGENEWRYASVKFGKVTLEQPKFWTGEKFQADNDKEYLDLLPRHARLQNMTYSSRMKVHVSVQVKIVVVSLCNQSTLRWFTTMHLSKLDFWF